MIAFKEWPKKPIIKDKKYTPEFYRAKKAKQRSYIHGMAYKMKPQFIKVKVYLNLYGCLGCALLNNVLHEGRGWFWTTKDVADRIKEGCNALNH